MPSSHQDIQIAICQFCGHRRVPAGCRQQTAAPLARLTSPPAIGGQYCMVLVAALTHRGA
jgi:hypothetical protein